MAEQRETCSIIDFGDTVVVSLTRAVGHVRLQLPGPISTILRALRGLEWQVVGTGCDATGYLRVHLDRCPALEREARAASRTRTLGDAD